MVKIFYLLVIFSMLCNCVQAQDVKIGFRAGANFSQWSDSENNDFETILGFYTGPYVNISTSKLISFELGLYFSRKGAKSHSQFDDIFENKHNFHEEKKHYKINYLDFPVFTRLTLFKGLSVYAGPQFSLLLNKIVKTESLWIVEDKKHIFESTDDDITINNRLDLAIVAGLGYRFNSGLNINASYDYGLYKIYNEKWFPETYNRVVKISVGYLF